jgi:hypothetical protein
MRWGKVWWSCPNCGKRRFSDTVYSTAISLCHACSKQCADAWELKMARHITGKDEDNGTRQEPQEKQTQEP